MTTDELLSIALESFLSRWIKEYCRNDWVAVTGGAKDSILTIIVYVDREVDEDDIEILSLLGGYIWGDFSPDEKIGISEKCISLNGKKPEMLDFWIFNKFIDA